MKDPVFISYYYDHETFCIKYAKFVFDYGKKTKFLKFDCGSTKSKTFNVRN
jgi:hypothetical protein